MEIPTKIESAAQRLKQGHRVNRITVRDFLRHFGAERRGAVKVQGIRTILNALDLDTEPDFETAWIDGPLWLRLKDGVLASEPGPRSADTFKELSASVDVEDVLSGTPSAVEEAEEQIKLAPKSAEPESASENTVSGSSAIDDPTLGLAAYRRQIRNSSL